MQTILLPRVNFGIPGRKKQLRSMWVDFYAPPNLPYGSGAILELTTTAGAITGVSIYNGGTGYFLNNVLNVAGGTGGTVQVTGVNAGVITAVSILTAGTGYVDSILNVTNASGGTSSSQSLNHESSKAFDSDTVSYWAAASALPQWIGNDLGSAKVINRVDIWPLDVNSPAGRGSLKNFTIDASADGVSWTTIYTGIGANAYAAWQSFSFTNLTAYRYWRAQLIDTWGDSYNFGFMPEMRFYSVNRATTTAVLIANNLTVDVFCDPDAAFAAPTFTKNINSATRTTKRITLPANCRGNNFALRLKTANVTDTAVVYDHSFNHPGEAVKSGDVAVLAAGV